MRAGFDGQIVLERFDRLAKYNHRMWVSGQYNYVRLNDFPFMKKIFSNLSSIVRGHKLGICEPRTILLTSFEFLLFF